MEIKKMTNIKLILIAAIVVLVVGFIGLCVTAMCEGFMDDSFRWGVRDSKDDK